MKNIAPQLIANITLYPTEKGGRQTPISHESYGCPCKIHENDSQAWDCRILLEGKTISPGETKRFGFVFLSGEETASIFREAGRFFLWEGGIIGEAVVVK